MVESHMFKRQKLSSDAKQRWGSSVHVYVSQILLFKRTCCNNYYSVNTNLLLLLSQTNKNNLKVGVSRSGVSSDDNSRERYAPH